MESSSTHTAATAKHADDLAENVAIIQRDNNTLEGDYCEACAEYIQPREARYSFDIGGGAASLCVSCARDMRGNGSAILRGAK